MDKCLNPKCRREAETRGLCGTCYTRARKLVESGRKTWLQLEEKGRALPRQRQPSTADEWLLSDDRKGSRK